MRREWEPEELIAAWTLLDGDWELVGNRTGATRLGFGLMLKFFEQEGRFPQHVGELPKAAVDYMAGQVKVEPTLPAEYDWSGRSIERHRAQVPDAHHRQPTGAGGLLGGPPPCRGRPGDPRGELRGIRRRIRRARVVTGELLGGWGHVRERGGP